MAAAEAKGGVGQASKHPCLSPHRACKSCEGCTLGPVEGSHKHTLAASVVVAAVAGMAAAAAAAAAVAEERGKPDRWGWKLCSKQG